MSIQQEWRSLVQQGHLVPLEFLIPGKPEKRTVLMSSSINELVTGPWTDGLMEDRCNRLRADLENILAGEPLTVCWEPFSANKTHQIGRLHKIEEEVWDIRSLEKPGLRVFFRFADKDVLVTTNCSPRSLPVPWLRRFPLGAKESRQWEQAKKECLREWQKLFPAHDAYRGVNIDDYLSNAVLS